MVHIHKILSHYIDSAMIMYILKLEGETFLH